MRYDFTNTLDCQKARFYLDKLITDKEKAELTKKNKIRTLSQNALFHVWISAFADHIGESSREACKRDVKRELLGMRMTKNIFTGESQQEDYSTSKMDVNELAGFMDKFKIWAQTEYGCYLPYWKDAGYEEMINQYSRQGKPGIDFLS